MAAAPPRLSANTVRFLRALKRNNRREWFSAHRDDYEAHVRAPMIAIVERLAEDFREFAPELVASPKLSLYRIHRDTRFSENKAPYKTHAAAVFPTRGLPKHEGAGLYFHVSHEDVWIGGGVYAPPPPRLQAIREHIAANYQHLRAIVESPAFRRRVVLEGEQLTRLPRGFPRDHPAGNYLRYKQFIAGAQFPTSLAESPRLYATILSVFRAVLPLSRFLNTPIVGSPGSAASSRSRAMASSGDR
jgi:uncharacterized protein (TIGR02453 family)